MKKAKRLIAFFFTMLLCLSLCGCQDLEEMRAAHAFWQEDGSIKWNGDIYLPLEGVPEELDFTYASSIKVTEEDVPVLLSEMLGDTLSVNITGVLLHNWGCDEEVYFCREDAYDAMMAYLKQGIEMDTYYYTYWEDYNDDNEEYYYLTEEQGRVIDELMSTLSFEELDDEFYSSLDVDEYTVSLGRCDENHWFTETYVLEIAWQNGAFHLIDDDNQIGRVPAEYNATMRSIVKAYYKAEIAPHF